VFRPGDAGHRRYAAAFVEIGRINIEQDKLMGAMTNYADTLSKTLAEADDRKRMEIFGLQKAVEGSISGSEDAITPRP
jgi:hypothetical protein